MSKVTLRAKGSKAPVRELQLSWLGWSDLVVLLHETGQARYLQPDPGPGYYATSGEARRWAQALEDAAGDIVIESYPDATMPFGILQELHVAGAQHPVLLHPLTALRAALAHAGAPFEDTAIDYPDAPVGVSMLADNPAVGEWLGRVIAFLREAGGVYIESTSMEVSS